MEVSHSVIFIDSFDVDIVSQNNCHQTFYTNWVPCLRTHECNEHAQYLVGSLEDESDASVSEVALVGEATHVAESAHHL